MALVSASNALLDCVGLKNTDMEHTLRLFDNMTGRDKVMRTLQYTFRLAAFLHARRTGLTAKQSEFLALADNFIKAFGDGRRLFRLLKCLSSFLSFYKGIGPNVLAKRNLQGIANVVIRNFLLGFYYFFDHYIWFIKLKLVEDQRLSAIQLLSMRLWSVAAVISFLNDVYTYQKSQTPEAKRALRLKLLKSASDLPLALTSSLPEQTKFVSPGIVYASGVVASAAGLVIAWNDLKK